MTDDLSFPPSLRWRPATYPVPAQEVPVSDAEHHCARGCAHLAEAKRRGFEQGARAERERCEGSWLGFFAGLVLGVLLGVVLVAIIGGR